MTRRRWIADRASGDRAWLMGANAAHLARVLRARVGQEFEISAAGRVRRGRVCSITDSEVEFELENELNMARAPSPANQPDTVLLLAIFKFDRLEWAIEKATELGVSAIVPVIARRTDPHLAKAAVKRVARWRRLAHEAAQQSRRAAAPEIASPVQLQEALGLAAGTRILLAESGAALTLRQALEQPSATDQRPSTALAIGPEGGWTEDELAAFARAGWTAASLGANILRAETAALAALAVLHSLR